LFITTPSIKPSAQSRLVIEAVTMEAKQAEARWEKMMLAIEKLTGKVDAMEEERTLFRKQMEETGKAVSLLRVEAMARDMDRYGNEGAGERDSRNSQNRGERMHRGREESSGQLDRDGEQLQQHIPRMPFPKFGGTDPAIWIIQCEDYFNLYRVPDFLKSTVASLNFEGTAARWLQVVRLKQGLGDWRNLSRLVLDKFGAEEYPRAMRKLLNMRQKGGVE
jgi:hypothetical protein